MVSAPTPPFIQARNYTEGGNLPLKRIVIHATVSPCRVGGAKAIAQYFARTKRNASAHYVVDPKYIYQCVNDWDTAWHAPPNEGSIGIELCDPQEGPDSRWDDPEHVAMLDLAARLARQLSLYYDVPIEWRLPDELVSGADGTTDHENVSWAWGQTSHVDPGWSIERSDHFIELMNRDLILGESDTPEDPTNGDTYVVQDGDTLYGIGQKLNADWHDIADANGIEHPYVISPGQELVIPPKAHVKPEPVDRFTASDLANANNFPLPETEWFGYIYAGAKSHGGWYEWEQKHVRDIQKAMILKGHVPGISNPDSTWADGIFGTPTVDAVSAWQAAEKAATTSYYGQVWWDDWQQMFS